MKPYAIFVVAILIGGLVGAGAMYYYRESDVDAAFDEGKSYQQSLDVGGETPASVTLTFSATAFAHASTVGTDGSVSTETDVNQYLTIENTDESRNAATPKLMLYNPITGKEGLHDNLETDSTEVSVTIQGVKEKLYHDGEYTAGALIPTLTYGGEINVTVTITFETAVAGTFQDGQSYTCYIYFYQPSANYCDVASYTVTT